MITAMLLKSATKDENTGWFDRSADLNLDNNKSYNGPINNMITHKGQKVTFLNNIKFSSSRATSWEGIQISNSIVNNAISSSGVSGKYLSDSNSILWCAVNTKIFKSIDDGLTWSLSYSFTTSDITFYNFKYIIEAFGKIIAMDQGYCVYSSDGGETWNVSNSLKNSTFGTAMLSSHVMYNDVLYVAGSGGKIAKTSDGINWTYLTAVTGSPTLYPMWVSNSKIYAIDSSSKIYTSVNGTTWTTSTALSSTTYGTVGVRILINDSTNTKLFVSNWNGSKSAYSNNGGINWTYNSNTSLIGSIAGNGVYGTFFMNNTYFITGGLGEIHYSTDRINWYKNLDIQGSTKPCFLSTETVSDIEYDGTNYIVVGSNSRYSVSPDLKNWKHKSDLINTSWTVFGSRLSTAQNTIDNIIPYKTGFLISSWGSSGYKQSPSSGSYGRYIGYTDKILDYAGWVNNDSLASLDSITLTYIIHRIVFLNNKMFITGRYLAYADDFETLTTTKVVVNAVSNSTDIIYVNNTYICATENGTLYTSSDGITWTLNTSLKTSLFGSNKIYRITYFNDKYIVIGPQGKCFVSDDLITWTQISSVETYFTTMGSIYSLCVFRNELWIAGTQGNVMKTSDGVNWTNVNNPKVIFNTNNIFELKVLNDMLFLCGKSKLVTYK